MDRRETEPTKFTEIEDAIADGYSERDAIAIAYGIEKYSKEWESRYNQYRYARRNGEGSVTHFLRAWSLSHSADTDKINELRSAEPRMIYAPDGSSRIDPAWVTWQKEQIQFLERERARKKPDSYSDKQRIEHSGTVRLEDILNAEKPTNG